MRPWAWRRDPVARIADAVALMLERDLRRIGRVPALRVTEVRIEGGRDFVIVIQAERDA